ncbi:MAG TPA: hypothetical protein VJ908_02515 [Wenzhouxiangellaceae bacterium]|nr:hypothetical protein [Wenzhouxiangellaceae bacterium]
MKKTTGKSASRPWWKSRELRRGSRLVLELGPMKIELGHGDGEWLLWSASDVEDDRPARSRMAVRRGLPEEVHERFVHDGPDRQVTLAPVLGDRPVVARPRQPVYLLSKQEVTFYLSTPIWLKILVGSSQLMLRELASIRLSDTWFGPSTRVGELCYANRTHARRNLAEVPLRPHRAITPLRIRNNAQEALPLEKISLPVPMLPLFGAEDGSLWTQRATLVRDEVSDLASVRIEASKDHLDPYGRPLTRIAAPRHENPMAVVRAFSTFFQGF